MSKSIQTEPGKTYVVTMTQGGTLTGRNDEGVEMTLASANAAGQVSFQAVSTVTVCSDEAATVLPFEGALSAAVGGGSGGDCAVIITARDGIECGTGASTAGNKATALGNNAKASGDYSTALGYCANAGGYSSTALGHHAKASGYCSTTLGYYTTASRDYSTALGHQATAGGYYSTALGYCANAGGYSSTALGHHAKASGYCSTALGYCATAGGECSIALGYQANASRDYSTALGYHANAGGECSIALGRDARPTMSNCAALSLGVVDGKLRQFFLFSEPDGLEVLPCIGFAEYDTLAGEFTQGYKFILSTGTVDSTWLPAGDDGYGYGY